MNDVPVGLVICKNIQGPLLGGGGGGGGGRGRIFYLKPVPVTQENSELSGLIVITN